jgi:hypothetical protein
MKEHKIHFDPYAAMEPDEPIDKYPCGVMAPEEPLVTSIWDNVTCLSCLKNRELIQGAFDESEKEIVRQMGAMADFMNKEAQDETRV